MYGYSIQPIYLESNPCFECVEDAPVGYKKTASLGGPGQLPMIGCSLILEEGFDNRPGMLINRIRRIQAVTWIAPLYGYLGNTVAIFISDLNPIHKSILVGVHPGQFLVPCETVSFEIPAEIIEIGTRIRLQGDMADGTLELLVDGEFLHVVFSTLQRSGQGKRKAENSWPICDHPPTFRKNRKRTDSVRTMHLSVIL